MKPDYMVFFDRVYGQVPHRFNLHVTGWNIQRSEGGCLKSAGGQVMSGAAEGALITAPGRFDWIRKQKNGEICACVPNGETIQAFGVNFEGRGPWAYNMNSSGEFEVFGPTPRTINIT